MWRYIPTEELYHHEIEGQKWGIRRYQNEDGSLTAAGEKRYGANDNKYKSAYEKRSDISKMSSKQKLKNFKTEKKYMDRYNYDMYEERSGRKLRGNAKDAAKAVTDAYTSKKLAEIYGKETMNSYEAREEIKVGIAAAATVVALTGATLYMELHKY